MKKVSAALPASADAVDGAQIASTIMLAVALSLAAALSLGITRFAYGLLLPPMRADLGWSYTLAGSMNTSNAFGYFVGALMTPVLMRRYSASTVMLLGAILASLFMGLSGFFTDSTFLLLQRFLAGIASAWVFITGGVLAARVSLLDGANTGQPQRSGLLLGIYYGGSGLGIVVSALLVPALLSVSTRSSAGSGYAGWAWAWWALAVACIVASIALVWPARVLRSYVPGASADVTRANRFRWRDFAFSLAGYAMFGVGYIGYMTFVIALLKEQGASPGQVTLFYALLGLACMASSRVWAGLLDRHKSGHALAILNALLGVATVLPAITPMWPVVLLSGIVFGGVFLSVVASTTALVRHNLPASEWSAGIAAFTTVFAAGQVLGPVAVGWIADSAAFTGDAAFVSSNARDIAGLSRGLIFSALALWLGALLATRQRSLAR